MQEWTALVAAGALAIIAAVLGLALLRLRSSTQRAVAQARTETEELRRQVEALALAARPSPGPVSQEFVITRLGDEDESSPPAVRSGAAVPAVPAQVFVDLVVRESAVRAGLLVAGLRRALAPETRNRIRFEVQREIKRSRRHRKAETKAAVRAWRARERAGLDPRGLDEGEVA